MAYFVCLVRPSGAPVTERDRDRATAPARRAGLRLEPWVSDGCFAAMAVGTRLGSSPSTARVGSLSIVGTARLDDRPKLAASFDRASDLEVIAETLRARGAQALADLTGDFAFVSWNGDSQAIVAARDPLGVRQLFWASMGPDLLALSSHASLVAHRDAYSQEYIARLLAGAHRNELTLHEGVHLLPAGSRLRLEDERVVVERYWSPADVPPGDSRFRPEQVEEFRELFLNAVRARLPDDGSAWSELSGGLDTSAIVMSAEHLHRSGAAPTRLAGTVTYADSLGGGDESDFVKAVLAASGLPNDELRGHWPWQDDGDSPPESETPVISWSRDRRRDGVLRDAGADVLLSGEGGDFLFGGNAFYFADWVARGQLLTAGRELLRLSALSRMSFWKIAFANAVVPLLPTPLRSRTATPDDWVIPSWVNTDFRRRHDMDAHARSVRAHGVKGRGRSRYREAFENRVSAMAFGTTATPPSVDYERRYPFLHKPLVELALRIPPNDRGHRPLVRKWILREAMRGILPEQVRTRLSKGSAGSRMVWALEHERGVIDAMLQDPILAQMGCIDVAPLREAYTEARAGRTALSTGLFTTLALETWLRIRSGRWPVRSAAGRSSRRNSSTLNLQEAL